jgi:hypothetical protein
LAIVAVMALTIGLAFGSSMVSAQDAPATPDAGTPGAADDAQALALAFPAHIHSGTCDAVGDVVYPLSDLTPPEETGDMSADEGTGMDAGTPEADADTTSDTATGADADMATPDTSDDTGDATGEVEAPDAWDAMIVAESRTTIEASLDDILSGSHVINVHESAENIQNYIACGEISEVSGADGLDGTPVAGDAELATPIGGAALDGTPENGEMTMGRELRIQLTELNDSGYEGRATIVEVSATSLEVTVQLMHTADADAADMDGDDAGMGTTDMATPEADATPAG